VTTLPMIKRSREEKRQLDIVKALKQLQGATSKLVGANFYCEHAELMEFSKHLRKMMNDINTISQHLHTIYKKSPILYNNVEHIYNNLEIVVEEKNV
jgi:hypothetical protein